MGNILNTLKGMLSNKNTITILGVLLGVVAIYFVYDNRVKSTATEITVYYVKADVPANTQLKKENIGTVSINFVKITLPLCSFPLTHKSIELPGAIELP